MAASGPPTNPHDQSSEEPHRRLLRTLEVLAEKIPASLRELPRWVAFKLVPNKDTTKKPKKLPINPLTGELARINDHTTWGTFEQAHAWSQTRGGAGVLFALTGDPAYAAVDLDDVRDPDTGVISPEAYAIVEALNSYTELSPSGTGLHIIALGTLPPKGRKRSWVEMYDADRFMSFTGHLLEGAPATIEQRQEPLDALHAQVFGQLGVDGPKATPADDNHVMSSARRARDFDSLWSGDHSAYPSQSEADLALCGALARAGNGDAATVDRLFRQSGLFREKWDERHGDQTYGEMTVATAVAGCSPRRATVKLETVVATDGGDLRLVLAHRRGRARPTITAVLPDGSKFVDKTDVTTKTGRERFAEHIRERVPSAGEADLAEALDRLAEQVVDALEEDEVNGRDGWDGRDGVDPSSAEADLLTSLVVGADEVELFHTPGRHDAEAYATLSIHGRRESVRVGSKAFAHWLVGAYRKRFGKVPGTTALQNALAAIEAEAIYSESEHEVHVRVARHGESILIDLCDDERNAVRITADGWTIVPHDQVEVRFIRRRGMQALPKPVRGGSVDLLRPLVNISGQKAWVLFVSVLVAYLRPSGPFPVLVVCGEQGSAKSFLCRILRMLVDPSTVPLRRPPREERDLMIAASNSWVVAFDNVSRISDGLSDCLCSLATRGGFGTRQLYSDDEEKLFSAMRPVLVNGIGDIATRPDLLDRAVILHLQPIPRGERKQEVDLDKQLDAVLPLVLGALFDGVSTALKNHATVKLPTLPRMADFAVWATAAEPAFGWEHGTFMDAYAETEYDADAVALEASPIGALVIELMANKDAWEGTATELMAELVLAFPERRTTRSAAWPKSPSTFSTELNRVSPVMRKHGIEVSSGRQSGGSRTRCITLTKVKVGRTPSPASPPSPEPASELAGPVAGAGTGDAGDARDGDLPSLVTDQASDSSHQELDASVPPETEVGGAEVEWPDGGVRG